MRNKNGTGFIRWPQPNDGYKVSGENGMWVYGFWPTTQDAPLDAGIELLVDGAEPRTYLDPFVRCHGVLGTLALPLPDVVASPNEDLVYRVENAPAYTGPSGDAVERMRYLEHTFDAGYPVLAGVCLGSIGETYVDQEGGYWSATHADLTRNGRKLTRLMGELYGSRRPAQLVTYVDT